MGTSVRGPPVGSTAGRPPGWDPRRRTEPLPAGRTLALVRSPCQKNCPVGRRHPAGVTELLGEEAPPSPACGSLLRAQGRRRTVTSVPPRCNGELGLPEHCRPSSVERPDPSEVTAVRAQSEPNTQGANPRLGVDPQDPVQGQSTDRRRVLITLFCGPQGAPSLPSGTRRI